MTLIFSKISPITSEINQSVSIRRDEIIDNSTEHDIQFKPIDRSNWEDILKIRVHPSQQMFVPSPVESLATAYIKPWDEALDPYAIYLRDTLVGLFYLSYTPESEDNYWIGGLIIDKEYQGKGIGKKAMTEILKFIPRKHPQCKIAKLTVEKDNAVAQNLYKSLGFGDTMSVNRDGEIIYTIVLPTE